MGTKRESVESKIISYFRDESDEKAQLVYGLVKGIMAKRAPKKAKEPKVAAVGKKGLKETNAMPFSAPEPGRYEPVNKTA